MDLRNNQITVRELLADPKARQVLARQFPQVINRPIVAKSGSMTLDKAMKLGAAYVPQKSHSGDLGGAQAAVTGTGRESPALT